MSTESVATSYRGLFAEPVLRRLAVADACARLPQGMVSITLLLAAGAAVAGAMLAGFGAGRPILALALAVALALGSAASAAITGHAR